MDHSIASAHAAATTVSDLTPSCSVEDLTPGLLLFFARPSHLQTWAECFGHEWRHVGVVIDTPAGLRVASYGPKKCFRLDDPFEIMDAYTRVGVARVFDDAGEVSAVERFCEQFVGLDRIDAPYSFSAVLFGPIHLTARRLRPGPLRTLLFWIVLAYCNMQRVRSRDGNGGYGCSTFAWAALHHARRMPLRIPLSAHPEDEAAYATPSNPRDDLFARWLCGPMELWQAISPALRTDLDLQAYQQQCQNFVACGEVVIDLRELDVPVEVACGEVVIDLRELETMAPAMA